MRNQPETVHEYNIPRLNWWFVITSALFVGCFALMIWMDFSGGEISPLGLRGDRQWKNYQHEFYALEKKRLAADEQAAQLRADEQGLGTLAADEKKRNEQLAAKKDELDRRQAEAAELKVEADRIMREYTMAKATRDQVRSFYEAALERKSLNKDNPEVQDWLDKVETANDRVAKLDLRNQEADATYNAAQAKVEELVGHRDAIVSQINRLLASKSILSKRLTQLRDPLVQMVVNAPVMEFASATYKVEQIVTESHHVDVNFTTVPRVDRCITCHKAIDRKDNSAEEKAWRAQHKVENIDWSKLPHPLRNHPRQDLYVSDTSPHPLSKFGCTTCHWGWDRETDFSRAGHTPDAEKEQPYVQDEKTKEWVPYVEPDEEEEETPKVHTATATAKPKPVEMTQREVWEKNHDWEQEEFLTEPMRAKKYVEASCLKCHSDQTQLEGGAQLDHGRRLIEQLGCWSCHKMKPMETYSTHHVAEGETLEEICKLYDVVPAEVRKLNNLAAAAPATVGRELQIPLRTLHKVGPSLYQVAAKDTKEWTRKWLHNPVAFRPNTYMPQFWGLSNNKDTPVRNDVEINAVTEFLFAVSEKPTYPPPPVTGDAAHGKELVQQVGCLACHVIDDKLIDLKPPRDVAKFLDKWEYRRARSQGPQLGGTGSKTDVNWLYAWLKDPKQYNPRTKMPNLRLSDQEAADIAAYLRTLANKATDAEPLAPVDKDELAAVTLEYLQVMLSRQQAEEKISDLDDLIEAYFADEATAPYYSDATRLAREQAQVAALQKEYEETYDDAVQKKMETLTADLKAVQTQMAAIKQRVAALTPEQKKNVFVGGKLIGRYGCFACHDIRGFENAKPIGTELSEWGSKPVSKLDFGLQEIEHDRIAWFKQKLHEPRSFDIGRIGVTRSPQELLKMGKFNITDEQIDQIATVISGMTDEKLTADEPRKLTPAEHMMERGRWLVKELNCTGCHQVEGKGWAIRATGILGGMEPLMFSGAPTQLRQGQRTQPDWLFHFLRQPQTGQIRPWLRVRMPTFGLTDAEANVLVKYFAYEGRAQFPYQTATASTNPAHLAAGKQLFEQLKCALCHIVDGQALGKPLAEIPEEDLPRLAPNLSQAGTRLQRDRLINRWLPEPLAQVPGTRMPQFEYGAAIAPNVFGGDGLQQREALVDYVLSLGAAEAQAVNTGSAAASKQ